jgi:hypothetical protein
LPCAHYDGQLRFEFSRPPGRNRPEPQHFICTARLVGDKVEVEGLTAIAHDCDEALPGPMSVQGDHGPVEIRDMTVVPLTQGKM